MVANTAKPFDVYDVALHDRIYFLFRQRQLIGPGRVTIEARDGVVTLRGTVPSFYRRQLLYSTALHVSGVMSVIDELEVTPWRQP